MQENTNITLMQPTLDLGITELEAMEAPGFWDTAAGVGAGIVVGGGAVYGGLVIGVAIT